jgi:iron(III) transport system permease protein
MLIFTGTIFELPASELLQPPGQPPLAVQITGQYNNFKQGPGTAMTILALVIVIVLALLVLGAMRLLRLRGGGRVVGRGR